MQSIIEDFQKTSDVADIKAVRHLALLSLLGKAIVGDLDYFKQDCQIVTKEFLLKENCSVYWDSLASICPDFEITRCAILFVFEATPKQKSDIHHKLKAVYYVLGKSVRKALLEQV